MKNSYFKTLKDGQREINWLGPQNWRNNPVMFFYLYFLFTYLFILFVVSWEFG